MEIRDKKSAASEVKEVSKEHRRLAAIMFTDMVGYTALLQRNEKLALQQLDEHRNLLRPIFRASGGREINAMGDAFLVEFASALQAVQGAIEIQKLLHERNASQSLERTILVRIGIHLGDILPRGRDVYGDAVNIASRIEELATAGGICISQNVADGVRGKIDYPIARLGTYELKNVELPMEVYRVSMPWGEGARNETIVARRQRVAVLPLSNISPDPKDEYFADGMTEELVSTLSNVANLGVIARTSVMRYKGTSKGIYEIARELNVAAVLEGSVRKSANKLRVTVQLVDGRSEEHVWSKTFDKEMEDIFRIQREIAQSIAGAMEVGIKAKEKQQIERRATQSIAAHTLYLKGRYYWNKRTEDSLKSATEYFKEAIAEAPDYAPAYVGLADCYRIIGSRGFLSPEETFPKAKALAKKALELDDTLAEAHAALASSLDNEWDWSGAERDYRRAIELNPSYASAYQWYALHLGHMGRFEEGIQVARKGEELDPLSPVIAGAVFEEYYLSRQYDRAIDQCKKMLELDPNFPLVHNSFGLVYIQKGMLDEAVAELQKAVSVTGEAEFKANLAYAYAVSGQKEKARTIQKDLINASKKHYVSAPILALVHLGLGEKEEAFKLLEKGWKDRSESLKHLMVDPMYDSLRSDSRYLGLLTRMGMRK